MPWSKVQDHSDCPSDEPWAVVKDETGEVEGCHATEEEADSQIAALNAAEGEDNSTSSKSFQVEEDEKEMNNLPQWEGVLAIEGSPTGDGREFAEKSLVWGELPIPLRRNIEDSHGGEPKTTAVLVGRIDEIWRDGNMIKGRGVFDINGEHGAEAHRLVKEEFLKGVSIDADDISEQDIELIFPEEEDEEGFLMPEKMVFHHGRIRAATLVDMPAFIEAEIKLTDNESEPILASADVFNYDRAVVALADLKDAPPAHWFSNPNLSVLTGITVTDEGRVYGHAAEWGTCHVGMPDVCVTPPEEDSHPYFMTGEVVCSNGERVAVGQITVGTGHAGLGLSASRAAEHYDNTGTAVADVAVGNDEHGIWVAGAIRPGVDISKIKELRASGRVSGDWRRIGGQLRMVGLLAVNVPGFPIPELKVRVSSQAPLSLVAAGKVSVGSPVLDEDYLEKMALRAQAQSIARRVGLGKGS